jgi:hypothetical protein
MKTTLQQELHRASDLLRCAAATAYESSDHLTGQKRDLAFSMVHLVDIAQGLVERSWSAWKQVNCEAAKLRSCEAAKLRSKWELRLHVIQASRFFSGRPRHHLSRGQTRWSQG